MLRPSEPHRNLALASVTAFFLLFPLTLGKPGLPPHLKADEAAYYLASLSLAHDRDLRVEAKDVDRAFEEFPYGPVNNMIVMTDDGWHTVYFAKPYIYSLFAAPFAWLFGGNGIVFFNMLLTMAMVWMGYFYLRRYNPPGVAALFSASFFLLSVGFSYVFWLQPEVFNMAAVAACLFFGLPRADESGLPDRRRELLWAALSGAVLVLAVYNKPMFGAVGLAPLWAYARQRRWQTLGAWVLGAVLSLGAVAGVATALTGHPSAYLGVRRQGVTLCEPGKVPITPEDTKATGGVAVAHSTTGNAWTWLVRKPDVTLYEVAESIGYFLVGRHTGMLVYTPFAGLAVLFFLLWGRRSGERWVLFAAVSAVALFFLVSIAWNWQGGGGFVGNRYFISVIPAFLFLVTEIRPRWLDTPGVRRGGALPGSPPVHAVRGHGARAHSPGPRAERAVPLPAVRAVAQERAWIRASPAREPADRGQEGRLPAARRPDVGGRREPGRAVLHRRQADRQDGPPGDQPGSRQPHRDRDGRCPGGAGLRRRGDAPHPHRPRRAVPCPPADAGHLLRLQDGGHLPHRPHPALGARVPAEQLPLLHPGRQDERELLRRRFAPPISARASSSRRTSTASSGGIPSRRRRPWPARRSRSRPDCSTAAASPGRPTARRA